MRIGVRPSTSFEREDLDVAPRPLAPAGDGQRLLGLREQAVIADRPRLLEERVLLGHLLRLLA